MLGESGFFFADVPVINESATLVRKNLLRGLLGRPGASALSESAGGIRQKRPKTDTRRKWRPWGSRGVY